MKKITSLLLSIIMLLTCLNATMVSAVTGDEIVNEAHRWIGTPYGHSDGSGGPGTLVDCSGLTKQVYGKFGYSLIWYTEDQANAGTYVDKNSMQPGDLVCMSHSNGRIGHVGIYIGNGQMIHASSGKKKVMIGSNILTWTYENAGCRVEYGRRIINTTDAAPNPAPTGSGISNPNQIIRYGHSGTAVKELQQSLNQILGANLEVDGKFGDKTLAAVKQFQSQYGLTVDGDAGPNTNNKINSILTPHSHSFTIVEYESVHPHKQYKKCSCGETQYTGETRRVDGCAQCHEHAYNEIKYESDHPHKQYKKCSCGDTQYTGETRRVDGCAQCHEHVYDEINYEENHPHKQYKKCGCGEIQYTGKTKNITGCKECHMHSYEIKYERNHPHKQYKECSCGETLYTGKTQKKQNCETCYPKEEEKYSQEPVTVKLQIGVPTMSVGNNKQEIDPGRGTVPVKKNDRTLLPIRAVVEAFGATVMWDEMEEKVTVYRGNTTIELWIDSTVAMVNNKSYVMDVAPIVINDRTFMPLRFIAESLGLTVGWNEANQTVTIEGEL